MIPRARPPVSWRPFSILRGNGCFCFGNKALDVDLCGTLPAATLANFCSSVQSAANISQSGQKMAIVDEPGGAKK